MDEKKWIILARYLSGECSEDEIHRVENWIAKNPENKRLLKLVENIWNVQDTQHPKSDIKKLWNELSAKAGLSTETIQTHEKIAGQIKRLPNLHRKTIRMLRYAAVLFIIILSYMVYNQFDLSSMLQFNSEYVTLNVKNGDRQQIILSDGSKITLDAGSTLKYPVKFDGDTREVSLDGEAFFHVTSDSQKPFIVHAGNAVIAVLGTKFNVRAWPIYKRVQLAVVNGKVSFNSDYGKKKDAVILTSGFSSTISGKAIPSQPQKVDILKYTSWMHNEIIFDNTPLNEILYQLERWYNVQIILTDNSLAQERLTVHVQNQSLEDILNLIAALTDLQYQRRGNSVYLR